MDDWCLPSLGEHQITDQEGGPPPCSQSLAGQGAVANCRASGKTRSVLPLALPILQLALQRGSWLISGAVWITNGGYYTVSTLGLLYPSLDLTYPTNVFQEKSSCSTSVAIFKPQYLRNLNNLGISTVLKCPSVLISWFKFKNYEWFCAYCMWLAQ